MTKLLLLLVGLAGLTCGLDVKEMTYTGYQNMYSLHWEHHVVRYMIVIVDVVVIINELRKKIHLFLQAMMFEKKSFLILFFSTCWSFLFVFFSDVMEGFIRLL